MAIGHHRPSTTYSDAVHAMTRLISHPDKPTKADIARETGRSEAEISALFPEEQSLLQASLEIAVILLQDRCIQAVVKVDPNDQLAQFLALADAYLDWANEHPQAFAILGNVHAEQAPTTGNLERYELALHELMLRLLRQARDKGLLAENADLRLMVATSRSVAYGLANKMLSGNLSRWMNGEDGLSAARRALHLFVRQMIGAKPT
ncbi:MAG: TetR-like C-terminal domain-containing protein [Paracoccus sp. (in: a-proteobacteria)]|uniref:WHG domain-containing protein n=1 Tax=Paracoccus sp. TaxID=267 RepID=UPI0039E71C9A